MIKMNMLMFLTILEAFVIVALLAIFWYFRAKKYKPYFDANTQPELFIKRWLTHVIEYTRIHAMTFNKAAKRGEADAIEQRLNMVARLNWLSLERDFIERGKPKAEYWIKLSKQIGLLLKRWKMVKFINELPDADAIDAALTAEPGEASNVDEKDTLSDYQYDEEDGPPPTDLKERVAYLEKQLRKLSSYKSLFFGLQSTYDEVQKSYKKLKKSLSTMALNAEQTEALQKMLAEHEANESSLEAKLKQMEDNKERMAAELQQLEALFNMQQQEIDQAKNKPPEPAMSSEDQARVRELVDSQQTVLREIMAVIHTLPADAETKMGLSDRAREFERNNREIETCVTMLEMEMTRLQQELTLHRDPEPTK